MPFILKKAIGGLLLPLPFILLIMAVALVLLWFTRWQKAGKVCFLLSWLVLALLSLQPVADALLRPLESSYPTYRANSSQPLKYVVVLGGGYTYNPDWAPSSNLISNSLPRVTEGIRIYRENPGSKMIFTGGRAIGNPVSTAEVAAKVAVSLGVPQSDIIMLDTPRDTHEEAVQVKIHIGEQPMALVTSANHLPRALIFFQQQGLHPIPAPANQLAIDSPLNPWEKILPSSIYLGHSERVWYESMGRIWQRIGGSAD
jgi:uncharacterized SAM-binding protein YcdF (DUF218 family)